MTAPIAPSVALVDDHLLLAEALSAALIARGVRTHIITELAAAALVQTLVRVQPDLVLLDLDLGPFGDSTSVIAALVTAGLRVLVVTGSTDRFALAAALEQGAIGCQSKGAGFDALVAATSAALQGSAVTDPAERAQLLHELALHRAARAQLDASFQRLTDREQGALRALGDGHSVHEIAELWVVSEATVRSHVRGVLEKLGVGSQLAAVAQARRNRWLAHL